MQKMNLYNESKLMQMVAKKKADAKDGSLVIDGQKYVFTFNQYQDYYEITLNGEIEHRLKERNLSKAKAWFKNYMENWECLLLTTLSTRQTTAKNTL